MKRLLLGIIIVWGFSAMANTQPVDGVERYTTHINSTFLQDCIDSSYDYELKTVACTVYKTPEGRRIFDPGSFVATLRFVQQWSWSACGLENADQLYLRHIDGEIIIVASDSKCFEIMRNSLIDTKLSEKAVSLYTIKN